VGGVSEERQAQYLVRQWLANLAAGVNVSIFYDWRDDGDDPRENEHRFGTVRRDFAPKPSFLAARKLIAELNGYTFRHRLQGKTDRDWRLLFQKADGPGLALVTWTTDEKAPEAARTPSVRHIRAADADFRDLRRLAAIRYSAGARAEGMGQPARVSVAVTNPEATSARVGIAIGTPSAREQSTALAPGKRWEQTVPIPLGTLRDDGSPLPIRLTWDNKPLPPVAPLVVRRTDPLIVTATPRGPDLLVAVENPARTALDGTLALIRSGKATERPLKIAKGVERVEMRLPSPGGNAHHLRLADKQGNDVARTPSRRYLPFAAFPTQAERRRIMAASCTSKTRPGSRSRWKSSGRPREAPPQQRSLFPSTSARAGTTPRRSRRSRRRYRRARVRWCSGRTRTAAGTTCAPASGTARARPSSPTWGSWTGKVGAW
jgi:hypothetical protein